VGPPIFNNTITWPTVFFFFRRSLGNFFYRIDGAGSNPMSCDTAPDLCMSQVMITGVLHKERKRLKQRKIKMNANGFIN
jgi:hypothetical protein